MSIFSNESTVWGIFVGESGDQLECFNSLFSPFPPENGTEGYIAINWDSIGNMNMYKNNYADFLEKYRKVYPDDNERVLKTQANIVWNFAFGIKKGDYIISPSSASGYLLVGEVIGDYEDRFDMRKPEYKNAFNSMKHLRRVKWIISIQKDNPKYSVLNKIGQLTLVKPDITVAKLFEIIS